DPNKLIVWVQGNSGTPADGGVWRSTNALAAPGSIAFTQTLATTTNGARGAFSIYNQSPNPSVVYLADGEQPPAPCGTTTSQGALRVSVDGGVTWSAILAGGRGFCSSQCFYDIGLAVLPGPTTAQTDDVILLGGGAS